MLHYVYVSINVCAFRYNLMHWLAQLCTYARVCLDFGGSDSGRLLILRGGTPRSMGSFPEIRTQRFLAKQIKQLCVCIYIYMYIHINNKEKKQTTNSKRTQRLPGSRTDRAGRSAAGLRSTAEPVGLGCRAAAIRLDTDEQLIIVISSRNSIIIISSSSSRRLFIIINNMIINIIIMKADQRFIKAGCVGNRV